MILQWHNCKFYNAFTTFYNVYTVKFYNVATVIIQWLYNDGAPPTVNPL